MLSGRADKGTRNPTALSAPLPTQNGLWSRLSRIWAEDLCSTEEKWSFLTLFIPLSTDLPPNIPLRSHTRNHSPYARSGHLTGSRTKYWRPSTGTSPVAERATG